MTRSLCSKSLLSLAVLVGCTADAATLSTAGTPSETGRAGNLPSTPAPDRDAAAIAALRAKGPAGLTQILGEYDRAPADAKPALASTVDAVAAQRYATVARLYWYTDMEAAKAQARRQHRPILALRMLGRLDEDLSCANSRFFRTALYPNRAVADFLREQFVLLWTSEREVPRVTIDYGDGRVLMGTVTGNSIHYVLDAQGRVVDALPGLYAPSVFVDELRAAGAVVRGAASLPAPEAAARYARHLQARQAAIADAFQRTAGAVWDPAQRRLLAADDAAAIAASVVAKAQRATMSKLAVEVPLLTQIASGVDPGTLDERDIALWASIGQAMFGIGTVHVPGQPPPPASDGGRVGRAARLARAQRDRADRTVNAVQAARASDLAVEVPAAPAAPAVAADHAGGAPAPAITVLDARARRLVASVYSLGGMVGQALVGGDPKALLARFEQRMVADTAVNQVRLRPSILAQLAANPGLSMEDLNRWVYAEIFATPRSDAWLGLLPRDEYTGLPGDGVVVR
jgi:hypothetical protein